MNNKQLTQRLIAETLSTRTSALSPIEERLVSIAVKVYPQLLGTAAIRLSYDVRTEKGATEAMRDDNTLILAMTLALKVAGKMNDDLIQLRDEIQQLDTRKQS